MALFVFPADAMAVFCINLSISLVISAGRFLKTHSLAPRGEELCSWRKGSTTWKTLCFLSHYLSPKHVNFITKVTATRRV